MAKQSQASADTLNKSRQYWSKQIARLLVDRQKLSAANWQRVFERLLRDLPQHLAAMDEVGSPARRDVADPREPFLWAWITLQSMPSDIGQDYKRLKEGSVLAGFGIEHHAAALRADGYRWTGLKTARQMQVEWLAAVVRGLDADLAGIDFWPGRGEAWNEKTWIPEGYPCFVVPVQRGYRLENGKDRERRASRYHAIVPTVIGNLSVHLKLHDQVAKTDGDAQGSIWTYGAAVFPGMSVTTLDVGDDEFLVIDASLPDDIGVVSGQISQALTGRCEVLAWPELTMPPARQAAVCTQLRADPLGDPRRIPIVVLGSWHIEEEGQFYNRAEAVTGRGKALASCNKRRKFAFSERYEAIAPAEQVTLIVMEDRLVAVAICLDFCDDTADEVYRHLGADLVIVPSMGDIKTVEAHQRHAKLLQTQQGSVSLIVQQHPNIAGQTDAATPDGYSFTIDAPRATSVEQRTPFRSLQARR